MTTTESGPGTERTEPATAAAERPFEFGGVHHLALVCHDMARTVEFYSGVLGMPLTKTIELPAGMGQHFFFDCGGGDQLAFFWFPDGPGPAPGVAAPAARPDQGELASAVGSMNHVAFTVPPDMMDEYRQRLLDRGVPCTEVANHDDSEWGIARDLHPGVFVRSIYFQDPDGILLELAAWTRPLGPDDVTVAPADAPDHPRP
jgi:catechol 2,3-dioxygenase-like lactoylglutathione lyase family enzyme